MPIPYKVRVYETLLRFFRKTLTYMPTRKIVDEMGHGYYRTYRALRTLESDGLVLRKSRQSGWRPTLMTSGIYQKLLQIYRRTHLPVPSEALAIHMKYTTRHIRYQLTELENAGIVHRNSPRTGWQPSRVTEPPAHDRIIDTLHDLYSEGTVTTRAIADKLKITTRHARRLLAYFEHQQIITRPSPRRGWLPIPA